MGSRLKLDHSLPADDAGGFHTPRVIPERHSLNCACFAGMRIMHSFGAGNYYGIDNLSGALVSSGRRLGA
jgi:hypothetical protein